MIMELILTKGCYISKSKTNCGPCSFINLAGLKGNPKMEKELSDIGRIKPFYASDYTSFLVCADRHKKDVEAYTSSRQLNSKMFKLMIHFENIPENKRAEYIKKAINNHHKINKRFSQKIKTLRNPLQKIDYFLNKNHKMAVLISDYYLKKKQPVPHWIVAFKKVGNKYYFMDSAKGIISLTKQELKKGFTLNKKNGFYPQLVVFKEQN